MVIFKAAHALQLFLSCLVLSSLVRAHIYRIIVRLAQGPSGPELGAYSAPAALALRASTTGRGAALAFFAILATFCQFGDFFWPILILGQFVITPYSNIF